tara:strand:+ start:275 stop:652 length:378 start_codon:yes stop_codon:yes gene_type:complete
MNDYKETLATVLKQFNVLGKHTPMSDLQVNRAVDIVTDHFDLVLKNDSFTEDKIGEGFKSTNPNDRQTVNRCGCCVMCECKSITCEFCKRNWFVEDVYEETEWVPKKKKIKRYRPAQYWGEHRDV